MANWSSSSSFMFPHPDLSARTSRVAPHYKQVGLGPATKRRPCEQSEATQARMADHDADGAGRTHAHTCAGSISGIPSGQEIKTASREEEMQGMVQSGPEAGQAPFGVIPLS